MATILQPEQTKKSSKIATARETLRREAFARIEQEGGKELIARGLTVFRIAGISATSVRYVQLWLQSVKLDKK